MNQNICPTTTEDVLSRAAFLAPDLEAIVCGQDRRTYAQLEEAVQAIKAALLLQGVAPGDHVAVCAGNGPRWIELFYAVSGIGAVVVPVNTRFRAEEVRYQLAHSKAKVLFCAATVLSSDFLAIMREVCPAIDRQLPDAALPDLCTVVMMDCHATPSGALGWDDFLHAASGELPERMPSPSPSDVALIQYTSGTTSRPKGVLLTHLNMCMDAFVSGTRMGLRLGDRFHSVRPFFHVAGSTLSVLSSAQCLTTLVTMPRFEPGAALELMEREACTHFSGNDTIALMLLNHPDRPARRLSLRGAWVAASPPVIRRVIDELGASECVAGYGLSEASPNIAQSAWHEDPEIRISAAMLPEPGVSVRIWDTLSDAPAPTGQRGEIQAQGWNVMQGYFDQPDQTAAAFTADGWLRTGDLGTMDPAGRLIFVGRLKDIIRVGGENVAPSEIEDLLHSHQDVKQAVVVGVPDERLVEVPCAFVILNEGHSCPEAELSSWVKARIAGFKVPRYIRIVEGFETIGMTASSKIQRNKLAAHATSMLGLGHE